MNGVEGKIWEDNKWNASAHYRSKVFKCHICTITTFKRKIEWVVNETKANRIFLFTFFYCFFLHLTSESYSVGESLEKISKNDKNPLWLIHCIMHATSHSSIHFLFLKRKRKKEKLYDVWNNFNKRKKNYENSLCRFDGKLLFWGWEKCRLNNKLFYDRN